MTYIKRMKHEIFTLKKQYVHNLNEVKALVKEAYAPGREDMYQGTLWYSHTGEFICRSKISDIDFELVLENRDSLTIDVLEDSRGGADEDSRGGCAG